MTNQEFLIKYDNKETFTEEELEDIYRSAERKATYFKNEPGIDKSINVEIVFCIEYRMFSLTVKRSIIQGNTRVDTFSNQPIEF